LIVNELVTNAVKHGLGGRSDGTVRVELRGTANSFMLSVEDDGPGFDLEVVRNRTSGLQLVQGLARQLRGHLSVTKQPATRCTVQFS